MAAVLRDERIKSRVRNKDGTARVRPIRQRCRSPLQSRGADSNGGPLPWKLALTSADRRSEHR
jgi:hypothetical protein